MLVQTIIEVTLVAVTIVAVFNEEKIAKFEQKIILKIKEKLS